MKHKISYYKSVEDVYSKDYCLDEWIKSTITPTAALKKKVEKYRKTLAKEDKLKLPAVSISACFDGKRDLKTDFKPSGFICIDIDRYSKKAPCNLCIDMQLVKDMLKEHPCTYFCGYSLSQDGIYAIIKITECNKLDEYFEFFKQKFLRIGVNIDQSCRDYTRLRFFSYDAEAYYNPNAKSYNLPKKEVLTKPKKPINNGPRKTNTDKVEKVISEILRLRIDITQDYADWIKIAGALNSEFGDNGKYYFDQISSVHPDYDKEKTSKKYDQCKKMNKTILGTLFMICSDYGIRY